jgi:ribulose 1,5-bisphosphate synthetase/thiazole synthase
VAAWLSLHIIAVVPDACAEDKTADVVVYGGTPAGVAAAIQIQRMDHSVVLIEPTMHLGGMTTNGLGMTDTGDKSVIGGIAREFYQRVKRHYDRPSAWRQELATQYDRYRSSEDAMWTFEPHVAEEILREMLAESQVDVVLGQRLDRSSGVVISDHRVRSLRTLDGNVFRGDVFVDATYEGDLMAAAGVRYTVGREANAQYGESLNGLQPALNTHNHRFPFAVDPFVTPGRPDSGLLPGIHPAPLDPPGTADAKLQAYCYRMCMTNAAENRVPFTKPKQYEPRDFELLLRNFEAGDLRVPMHAAMMPNRKTDTNNNGAVSTDFIGQNYDYAEASYEQRDAICRAHRTYQQGLMWTLANHPRVPESVRTHMAQWGLAADEFQDNDHWPYQLYVREARRMVSDYVVTEADCRSQRVAIDSVGMGSYNMDSHNVQRYVTADGHVQNEGDVQVAPGGAYVVSYRAIVPRKGDAENLAVPVCVSSSHIAYGSIRMEPVFMILGQSAGVAACLAIEHKLPLQELPYDLLSQHLRAHHQILRLPGGP